MGIYNIDSITESAMYRTNSSTIEAKVYPENMSIDSIALQIVAESIYNEIIFGGYIENLVESYSVDIYSLDESYIMEASDSNIGNKIKGLFEKLKKLVKEFWAKVKGLFAKIFDRFKKKEKEAKEKIATKTDQKEDPIKNKKEFDNKVIAKLVNYSTDYIDFEKIDPRKSIDFSKAVNYIEKEIENDLEIDIIGGDTIFKNLSSDKSYSEKDFLSDYRGKRQDNISKKDYNELIDKIIREYPSNVFSGCFSEVPKDISEKSKTEQINGVKDLSSYLKKDKITAKYIHDNYSKFKNIFGIRTMFKSFDKKFFEAIYKSSEKNLNQLLKIIDQDQKKCENNLKNILHRNNASTKRDLEFRKKYPDEEDKALEKRRFNAQWYARDVTKDKEGHKKWREYDNEIQKLRDKKTDIKDEVEKETGIYKYGSRYYRNSDLDKEKKDRTEISKSEIDKYERIYKQKMGNIDDEINRLENERSAHSAKVIKNDDNSEYQKLRSKVDKHFDKEELRKKQAALQKNYDEYNELSKALQPHFNALSSIVNYALQFNVAVVMGFNKCSMVEEQQGTKIEAWYNKCLNEAANKVYQEG